MLASNVPLGNGVPDYSSVPNVPEVCGINISDPTCVHYINQQQAVASSQAAIGGYDFGSTYVPFGSSSVHVTTYETKKLSGNTQYSYVLAVSQYQMQRGFDDSLFQANNIVDVRVQPNDMRINYSEEINPVSPETIVGVIAGFYAYVGLIFGLVYQTPSEAPSARLGDIPVKIWKRVSTIGGKKGTGEAEMAGSPNKPLAASEAPQGSSASP